MKESRGGVSRPNSERLTPKVGSRVTCEGTIKQIGPWKQYPYFIAFDGEPGLITMYTPIFKLVADPIVPLKVGDKVREKKGRMGTIGIVFGNHDGFVAVNWADCRALGHPCLAVYTLADAEKFERIP